MTQRNKNRALILGLLTLLFIAFRFGIAKTITLSKEVTRLKKEEALYQSAPAQLTALTSKEQQLNTMLANNNISGNSVQNNLLTMLNTTSKNLSQGNTSAFKILAFETPHHYKDEQTGSTVITHNFVIEGSYNVLIKTIYLLEQEYSFGNVVHVAFEKKKDFRTGKSSLQCTVLLQYIK